MLNDTDGKLSKRFLKKCKISSPAISNTSDDYKMFCNQTKGHVKVEKKDLANSFLNQLIEKNGTPKENCIQQSQLETGTITSNYVMPLESAHFEKEIGIVVSSSCQLDIDKNLSRDVSEGVGRHEMPQMIKKSLRSRTGTCKFSSKGEIKKNENLDEKQITFNFSLYDVSDDQAAFGYDLRPTKKVGKDLYTEDVFLMTNCKENCEIDNGDFHNYPSSDIKRNLESIIKSVELNKKKLESFSNSWSFPTGVSCSCDLVLSCTGNSENLNLKKYEKYKKIKNKSKLSKNYEKRC